ncbi:aldo/keto reductase [Anaerosporomusa subterranea]|uniref:Aldo/keto reductase n=1 Tax=Anaerosporomusa subterranea TaxID=1794912 RepID=A0A154BNK3_ANASB|nr:aldo/keto reductase [Anaerosporomusa subterranea]KYZ75455.1 aldo/keto reductase [Anaerosporomusa subterranea]
MKYISIPGLERGCSQLVIGTSLFTPERKDVVFEMLDAYVENGGNTLDTSRIYSLGKSEQALAMWLKGRRNRDEMVIISKCCHHYIDENGCHHPDQQRVSPEYIRQDLQESLARMQVDYFDICLLHRDDLRVPVSELMDALQEHKDAGLYKAYGVSNWSTERMTEAIAYCATKGYAGLAANSPSLSLAKVNEPRWIGCVYPDADYIQWHKQTQLAMFSWAAQASGFFAGLYTPEVIPNPDIARVYYSEANWERFRRAKEMAVLKGRQYTTNHIALAYVLNQPYPTCAVIGPQKTEELLDSIMAVDIQLTEQELMWLDLETNVL